jgi:tetratricopeptide (TPR) repeat protein
VPRWIHAVIERGLRRDPDGRFGSMDELLAALERDPSRRRRLWAMGAAAAVACTIGVVAFERHQAARRAQCARGPAIVAEAWNPALERRVRAALEGAGGSAGADVASRSVERMDDYARRWADAYRTVAEATLLRGEQSAAVMDRRLQCLEREREQLEALADVLSQADASVVDHAIDAAYALPAPSKCVTSDLASVPALPSAPDLRARSLAVEREVARATALGNAGQDPQVEELVERALPEARAIPDPRAEAELLLLQGRARRGRGDTAGALPLLQAAVRTAVVAADDATAARAASAAASIVCGWLRTPAEAEVWVGLADAFAQRAGHDDTVDSAVLHARALITTARGHHEQALALHDREIAILERTYGERDPRVAAAILSRATTRIALGQSEQAIADLQRSIDVLAATRGPTNPHLDLPYYNLGVALLFVGRWPEAKAAFQRALDLQSGRPPGALTISIFSGLIEADDALGDPDAAVALATQGMEIARASGQGGQLRWDLLRSRADAREKKGDLTGKREDCRQILEEQKALGTIGPDRSYHPDSLLCLGEVELASHRTAAALEYFEQSAALEDRPVASELPTARFALARSLRLAGRDPQRARALARSAREGMIKLPGHDKEVAEIDRWLDEADAPSAGEGRRRR